MGYHGSILTVRGRESLVDSDHLPSQCHLPDRLDTPHKPRRYHTLSYSTSWVVNDSAVGDLLIYLVPRPNLCSNLDTARRSALPIAFICYQWFSVLSHISTQLTEFTRSAFCS